MFSFPWYERLKTDLPEFEQVRAFQAGGSLYGVRPQEGETTARPLRSVYLAGNNFSTLGVPTLFGRVITPEDDSPASPPVLVLSHHVWQSTYGGEARGIRVADQSPPNGVTSALMCG